MKNTLWLRKIRETHRISSCGDFAGFFFSIWVFFHEHSRITGLQGKGEGHFFNSSLPLPPALQTFRRQPGNYCRELTSAHSQQPSSNREALVSEHKSLTTKLRTPKSMENVRSCKISGPGNQAKSRYFMLCISLQTNLVLIFKTYSQSL